MPMTAQEITRLGDKAAQIGHLLAPFTGAERELILKMVPYCRNCGQDNAGGNECGQCFEKEYRCPKCGAAADERFDCCEVHAMTTALSQQPQK